MLATRVATAVVILIVLVAMLFFAPAALWALFVLAIALVACWEWSRLCGLSARALALYQLASGAIGAAFWVLAVIDAEAAFTAAASTAFILATVFWILAAPFWLAKRLRPGEEPGAHAPPRRLALCGFDANHARRGIATAE